MTNPAFVKLISKGNISSDTTAKSLEGISRYVGENSSKAQGDSKYRDDESSFVKLISRGTYHQALQQNHWKGSVDMSQGILCSIFELSKVYSTVYYCPSWGILLATAIVKPRHRKEWGNYIRSGNFRKLYSTVYYCPPGGVLLAVTIAKPRHRKEAQRRSPKAIRKIATTNPPFVKLISRGTYHQTLQQNHWKGSVDMSKGVYSEEGQRRSPKAIRRIATMNPSFVKLISRGNISPDTTAKSLEGISRYVGGNSL
ncbi:hypothetical protein CEXT_497821 [Caerostris extrusa]|uniref:Uncharacterized protein n=1 Tax=Caerostris extrusa TaxID=172846 RepID=A0AAV4TUC7_CAEEX|nr:hypothetical protein CEXT_497821 [Caerostris extrusa]